MRRALAAACLLALAAAVAPAGAETCTPDDRVRACVDGGYGGSEGFLRERARVGAFEGEMEARGDWQARTFRFTNPPLNGAFACDPSGCRQEGDETFGQPVAHAALGAGGLTAGVKEDGTLTVLGWPGPGMYEHVNYVHISRGWSHGGAPANGGAFGGVLTPGGASFFQPEFGWRVLDQRYASDLTQTLVTELRNDALDADAVITDVVDPVSDVMARNVRVTVAGGSMPPGWRFISYANMNPTTARAPRVPSATDALADNATDFATVYDDPSGAMLHFRPYRVDPAALTMLATSQPSPAVAAAAVAGAFGPGVYVAHAGAGRPGEWQAGLDSFDLVREEAEGTPLADPYRDARDGHLSGSIAAVGKTAGAMAWAAPSEPDGSFTVLMAAAERPEDALAAVRDARDRGFTALRAGAETWWRAWIGRARLPATADPTTLAVARRALIAIRTAADRRTGAIVASITPQTPYRQDWVRDGSFFNYALLIAGYPEMVRAHNEFYRRVYRVGGTWDSFYYPDGAEAGFAYPYEIDSQAFALWALWLPYELRAPADTAALDELRRSWPAIAATADALLLCRDPSNDLQCTAAEDDAFIPTQGAQGAATVYLALRAAAEAADALGEPGAPRWRARAAELRDAALARLCTPAGCGGGRGGAYLAWPSRLLDGQGAVDLQSHLATFAGELDAHAAYASPVSGGFLQYPMEPILALAPLWTDAARASRLDAWVRWLTHDVAAPGVAHYGERIFRTPAAPGPGAWLHSVGFPHIWSGAETYLAAAFAYGIGGCPAGATRIGDAPCV